MAEHQSNDHHSASAIEDAVNALRFKLSDARDSSQKPGYNYDKNLDEISDWAKEQEKEKDNAEHMPVGDEENTVTDIRRDVVKQSGTHILDVISTIGEGMEATGISGGSLVKTFCNLGKKALELTTPQQPSVVDKVTEVSQNVSTIKDNFAQQTQSVERIEDKVDRQTQSVERIEDKVDRQTQSVYRIEDKVDRQTQSVYRIEDKVDRQTQNVYRIEDKVDRQTQNVDRIEDKVDRQTQSVYRIEDKMDQLAKSLDTIKDTVGDLRLELRDWMKEQKRKEKEKENQILLQGVSRVLITTVNSIEKLKSGNPLEITKGVLDIISSAGHLIGTCYSPIIGPVCGVISAILTESKPQQPSVVDQLAKVVHDELVHFNRRLQDQKYNGLKRRVSDQKSQLGTMKPGEKLGDSNLWNDYVQFMGELSNRFESPLPFKFEDNLTSDPDVADFVSAVITSCEAYCCFMALLIAAKGKFAELGSANKEDEDDVDRKISCQKEDAIEKLSFLSDEKYLTFLGRLPYEGGKLTKIVALSRNMRGKSVVEAVRGRLKLTPMQNLATVESAATKTARQSVKGKVKGHEVPPKERLVLFTTKCWVQFINETPFPIKIVSSKVGRGESSLMCLSNVRQHASVTVPFTNAGYIILYLNRILGSDVEPPAGNTRIIEFALSRYNHYINIQDKTSDEFTYGKDTYNKMKCGEVKTLYWFEEDRHFIARGEIVPLRYPTSYVWRFLFQDFDPRCEQDFISITEY